MAPSTSQLGIPPENIKGRPDFKPAPSLHISGYDSAIGGVKAAGVMGARVDCSESPPTIRRRGKQEPGAVKGTDESVTALSLPQVGTLGVLGVNRHSRSRRESGKY